MSKLPEWFNGSLYENGDKVRNRFSGEEYELTAEELSMYDFIQGAQIILEMDSGTITPQIIKDLQKGVRGFRENNSEAYMTLLD